MTTSTKTDPTSEWYMAGTENTGRYQVVLRTNLGRVGYRVLANNQVRIRVEPTDQAASGQLAGHFSPITWKYPGDMLQFRYSTVVTGLAETLAVLEKAIKALGTAELVRNAKQRTWRAQLKKHFASS